MSRFPSVPFLLLGAALALGAAPAFAGKFNLGRVAKSEEVRAWDIDVRPDGKGLPEGKGTVAEGDKIFQEQCAVCHGDFAEGLDRGPPLAGGQGTLKSERPEKTIGSYWPYLSTVYDYVHRAMPFGNAQSLTPDQTYAIVAYLLYMNDVVGDEFELSNENFTDVRLPNEENFIDDPRPDMPEMPKGGPCMKNCKTEVKITEQAAILNVTPTDEENPSASID